jgi:hypothetical protein
MTFPTVGIPDEDEKARIRREFSLILNESDIDTSNVRQTDDEQPAPKRGRGRPPGSRNKPKPSDFQPVYSAGETPPILASPPLSTRDQKEVAKRLAGILEGITGVAAVAKPYLQMREDEAEAIATPLSTYLIRTESTSGVAKQILEEYDIAAFVIALAAYVVRVYGDYRVEREQTQESRPKKNVTPSVRDEVDSKRETLRTVGETIPESSVQSQEGTERPVSREFASTVESGWVPAQL